VVIGGAAIGLAWFVYARTRMLLQRRQGASPASD
jgi:hypothetical protein